MRIHEGYKATWDGHMSTTKEITRNPTLREYYAGLAMQGLLSSFKHDRPGNIERGVRDSVLIADALIAELNKEAVDE
jgi:hypothetical protein